MQHLPFIEQAIVVAVNVEVVAQGNIHNNRALSRKIERHIGEYLGKHGRHKLDGGGGSDLKQIATFQQGSIEELIHPLRAVVDDRIVGIRTVCFYVLHRHCGGSCEEDVAHVVAHLGAIGIDFRIAGITQYFGVAKGVAQRVGCHRVGEHHAPKIDDAQCDEHQHRHNQCEFGECLSSSAHVILQ